MWTTLLVSGGAATEENHQAGRGFHNCRMLGDCVELSAHVAAAAWIAERLSPFSSGVVTSVVPGGFEAYARVLHPAEAVGDNGTRPVRWAEVAAWSGVTLVPGDQFSDIAMPEQRPAGPRPWSGQAPQLGTLYRPDADALAEILVGHTNSAHRCWFCMWEGWGPSSPGPRVRLPGRDYLLFVGPLAAMPSLVDSQEGRTPNLWWPDHHAWCVASEIDLPWTYVGGSAALIAELLADTRVESQPAAPDDSFHERPPAWLAPAIRETVTELLDSGQATLHTWLGTVDLELDRPQGQTDGSLRTRWEAEPRHRGSSWMLIPQCDRDRLRDIVTSSLTSTAIEL